MHLFCDIDKLRSWKILEKCEFNVIFNIKIMHPPYPELELSVIFYLMNYYIFYVIGRTRGSTALSTEASSASQRLYCTQLMVQSVGHIPPLHHPWWRTGRLVLRLGSNSRHLSPFSGIRNKKIYHGLVQLYHGLELTGWSNFTTGWSNFTTGWSNFTTGWSNFTTGWSNFAKSRLII